MRIKSQFKDYYDHMQKYVVGQSTVWNRSWCSMSSVPLMEPRGYSLHCKLGFCGKVYGFLYEDYTDWKTKIRTVSYFWSVEELYHRWDPKNIGAEERRRCQPYFSVEEDDNLFVKNNAPVFIAGLPDSFGRPRAVCLPIFPRNQAKFELSLKDLGFDKTIEAKDAYNDLINYIDFLGREHKEVPDMDDKVKIKSHGFDKHSFRTK